MLGNNEKYITQDLLNQHDNWEAFLKATAEGPGHIYYAEHLIHSLEDNVLSLNIFDDLADFDIVDKEGNTWFHYIFQHGALIDVQAAHIHYIRDSQRAYHLNNNKVPAHELLQLNAALNDNERMKLSNSLPEKLEISDGEEEYEATSEDDEEYEEEIFEEQERKQEIPEKAQNPSLLQRCLVRIGIEKLFADAKNQKNDKRITTICIEEINETDNVNELKELLDAIGIGFDNNQGNDNVLAPLRHRKENSINGFFKSKMHYRETNDTQKIAEAAFEKGFALFSRLSIDDEIKPYEELFDRDSRRTFASMNRKSRMLSFHVEKITQLPRSPGEDAEMPRL